MKKHLLLSMAFAFALTFLQAQELIVGGNMEDGSKWSFSSPNGSDVTDLVTATFDYQTDIPSGGNGGCLHLTGYGTTRSVVWQAVTITPGHNYSFTGYVKNVSDASLTNTWIEVILSRSEPDPETDYGAGLGDFIYTNNSWMTAPYGDFVGMDGEFFSAMQFLNKNVGDEEADITLTESNLLIPDTVSVDTWYVAIKAGCWNNAGVEDPTFAFLFDELSLIDLDAVSIKSNRSNNNFKMYPNPSNGKVNIQLNEAANVKIYNALGMEIKSVETNKSLLTFNLSYLNKGLYFVEVDNGKEVKTSKLILK